MLQFPVGKPLGTVEGMMLCPNLSMPGRAGITHVASRLGTAPTPQCTTLSYCVRRSGTWKTSKI